MNRYSRSQTILEGVDSNVVSREGKPRCLFISRYAPIRTQTDPYTGLPSYLSRHTYLTGIWNEPERGAVTFRSNCQDVIEVKPGIKGWLHKLRHAWKTTRSSAKLDVLVCGIDEHSLSLALLTAGLARLPVFAFAEDPPFTNRYSGPSSIGGMIEHALRRKITSLLLRRCNGIFCFVEKEALKDLKLGGVPIHQMLNCPSDAALAWDPGGPQPINDNGDFVVGLVGALCEEQGLGTLLEIIAEANKRLRRLRLRLIGPMDPTYAAAFHERARRLRVASAIEITGWIPYPRMLKELSGCSVGVYCNPDNDWYHVAQPLKISEYLALSKPVVAWDYPGTRRLLDQGRFGILVPPGDVRAFADALVRLQSRSIRVEIERQIRTAIMSKWSSSYWFGETLRIMKDRLGGTGNADC